MLSAFNVTSCVQQTIQTKDLFDQKDVMLACLPLYQYVRASSCLAIVHLQLLTNVC